MDSIHLSGVSTDLRPKLSEDVPTPSYSVNPEQLLVETTAFTDCTVMIMMPSIPDQRAAAIENINCILQKPPAHENPVAPVRTLSQRKTR